MERIVQGLRPVADIGGDTQDRATRTEETVRGAAFDKAIRWQMPVGAGDM